MRVHRITLYVVDHDQLGAESVRHELENARFANDCISPSVLSIETRDCGEWSDQHPLNFTSTAPAEIERLFSDAALRRLAEISREMGEEP